MQNNPTSIENNVAIITGASRRIGAQIARTLHDAGMRLCLHYRSSQSEAEQLRDELNSKRADSVILVQADLLQTEALTGIINTCIEHFGQLDLLVNNASTFYPTPIGQISEKDWDILLGSNLKAPLFLSQAAASELRKQRGSIINIIDIHSERPMKNHTTYSIAKSGLLALTKSLARELGPEIRVNGVAPGAILWPEHEDDKNMQQDILNRTALKRPGEPDDIANAVLFLFRDATYVTGHMLPVDGGRLLNI